MKKAALLFFSIIFITSYGISHSIADKFLSVKELKALFSGVTIETVTNNRYANPVEIKFSADGTYVMSIDGSRGYREREGKWWTVAPDKFCRQNDKGTSRTKHCFRFKKVGSKYINFNPSENKESYPSWTFTQ